MEFHENVSSLERGTSRLQGENISEVELSFGDGDDDDGYIFNQPGVRIPLLILYSIVFVFSFFGNLFVILVMTLHRRMSSYTNFFLTNLAVADLCVSVFCVYQNFAMYVIKNWYLGDFLCRMYHFINTLSYTASVIILVVVSGERYLAIVEPLKAKSILTKKNMVITMSFVWIFSALYSFPRFLYFQVATYPVEEHHESMCILRRDLFDTKTWDIVSLLLLYLFPLVFLTYLYTRIAQTLYKSSKLLSQAMNGEGGTFAKKSSTFCCQERSGEVHLAQSSYADDSSIRSHCQSRTKRIQGSFKSVLSTYISVGSVRDEKVSSKTNAHEMVPLTTRDTLRCSHSPSHQSQNSNQDQEGREQDSPTPNYESPNVQTPKRKLISKHPLRMARPAVLKPSQLVLKARRKVIHMLIIVVVCFAFCSLPFHARKMFQYFLPVYNHTAPFAYLLTPITFLFMYAHSAVNPLLYTAMSRRFRASLRDLLSCRTVQEGEDLKMTPRAVEVKLGGIRGRPASRLL